MPMLFQTKPGVVVRMDDPAMSCDANFLNTDPGISFDTERSIVTRMTIGQKVNLQFLHSMGSQIFVYVFGDRMGSISLSGLAFVCDCDGGPDIGAERMLLWYKRNKASKRAGPVRLTIGKTAIEGFVTDFTEDVVDPSLKLVQWGVNLAALPEDD